MRYSRARHSSNDGDRIIHELRAGERSDNASGASVPVRRSARPRENPRSVFHFALRPMIETLWSQPKKPVINTHRSRTNSATDARGRASRRELDVVNQNAETSGLSLECDV